MDFAVPVDHRVKNQRKRKERQLLRSFQRTKKAVEHASNGDSSGNWRALNDPRRKKIGNQRSNRDHHNYSIVEIGQNTEKSTGDLRRLAVTKTTVKEN